MKNFTKHDTMLWINHAIAHFKSLDKSQKDLAIHLGVAESRLSEMKNGSGNLNPSLMTNIIDLCGAPRCNSGRFEIVEMYDSFNEFIEMFRGVTENRFFRNLMKNFNNKSNIDQLCKHCYLIPSTFDPNQSDSKKRELTISRINELICSKDFNNICIQYKENLHLEYKYNRSRSFWIDTVCERLREINGLEIKEFEFFHKLYLLWYLSNKVENYHFASDDSVRLDPVKDTSKIVIIGSRLLMMRNQFNQHDRDTAINRDSEELFGKALYYGPSHSSENGPDFWGAVSCELYLSDQMNYHLLIHLAPNRIEYVRDPDIEDTRKQELDVNFIADVNPEDRAVVIANINPLVLFEQIREVRKWCRLSSDLDYELGKKIAKAGGYIPGAKVLI